MHILSTYITKSYVCISLFRGKNQTHTHKEKQSARKDNKVLTGNTSDSQDEGIIEFLVGLVFK